MKKVMLQMTSKNIFIKTNRLNLIYVLIIAACIGCNGCHEKQDTQVIDYDKIQKDLIEDNKQKHNDETKEIKKFIAKNKWPMQETKTGLNYWIYENGTGKQAKIDDIVTISFKVSLLDGTLCYQAEDNNPRQFKIGMDNVESGLHEVLQLMKEGDRCKAILPSHLAFGLTGDSDKIPSSASVVYDIHLLKAEE